MKWNNGPLQCLKDVLRGKEQSEAGSALIGRAVT
jgi:hypothetical protein